MKEFIIKRGDKIFEPSQYQKDILQFAHEGVGNGFINACAGASKTTILENIIYQVPSSKKKLFIAFNKSIVEEMNNRIDSSVENLNIVTYHSLGYSILKENFRNNNFIVNVEKYSTYLRNNILTLSSYGEINSIGSSYTQYLRNIILLIDYSRYYHASNLIAIKNVAEKYGLNILRDECIITKKMLDWGRNNINEIDFTDMVWLVNELNLTTKKHLYDIILVDEAQDTSVMQQNMTEICKKRGCRVFAVGDTNQAINVWCGADTEAVEKFKGDNVKVFTLPISYRCPKRVVEMAKKYSDNIVASENAIDGEIRYNVPLSMPDNNDMVLCRNTAPLIEYYLTLLRYNKKCYIKGSEDIYNILYSLITSTNATKIDEECNYSDGLFPKLYEMLSNNISKLISCGYTEEDATMHKSSLDIYDNICAIRVLSENLSTTEELLNKLAIIFKDESNEGIMLSTIHKAKGLESDNIFILSPSLLPNKYAKKEWEKLSEQHLIYVAYTRAKKTLNFMVEETHNHRNNSQIDFKKIKKELNNAKTLINSVSFVDTLSEKTKFGIVKQTLKNNKAKKPGLTINNIF